MSFHQKSSDSESDLPSSHNFQECSDSENEQPSSSNFKVENEQIFEAIGEALTFEHAVHLKQLINSDVNPENVLKRSRFVETKLLRHSARQLFAMI